MSTFPPQWNHLLEQQLSFFKTPVTAEAITDTLRETNTAIRVIIRNNRIYEVQKTASYVWGWRVRGYLVLLQDTLDRHRIPDVDLIINQCDAPISGHHPPFTEIPVFTFCKTALEQCILLPFTRFGVDDIGLDYRTSGRWRDWHQFSRWGDTLRSIQDINREFPWEKKDRHCFFAGHSVAWNGVRVRFCEMALDHPEALIGYLSYLGDDMEYLRQTRLSPLIGLTMPMRENPKFKYLMHLDGNTASDRLRYLLAFNSVVVKHESPFYEFYYPLLEPSRHYALVKEDLSDLIPTLTKLENDERLARSIAEEGARFAFETLSYENVLLYIREALTKYAQLQR